MTVTSRRDEVNVTVNHAEQVTDVTILEKGVELSAQDLSRLVLETIRKAGTQDRATGWRSRPGVVGRRQPREYPLPFRP